MDEMNHCIEIWMPGGSRRHSLYLTRPGVGPRDNQIALSDVERATERVQKYLAVYLMEVWGWGYTRVPFLLKIAGSLLFLLPWDIGYNYIPAPVHPYVTIIKSL